MKQKFTFIRLITTSFALVLALSVQAQQAKKISLQGFLKDANGKAVADGQQAITFKLYTQDAGGTAAWTEDQTINVFGGVYSTHLGKTVPLENLNWGASTYYVGVTVQGTELTPRTELTFAPYSLGSPKAQEVVCSGAVGDIKHSILNPEQFAQVNGNCWVPMDGRNLATTDKLRQLTGITTLPDGSGAFIRSQEFQGKANLDPGRDYTSPIAALQADALGSHSHNGTTAKGGVHKHSLNMASGTSNNSISGLTSSTLTKTFGFRVEMATFFNSITNFGSDALVDSSGEHDHTFTTDASGGSETRPDNLNFWVYIRIN